MSFLAGLAALCLIGGVLWDAFETIILPRRVTRRFRLTRLLYRVTWQPLTTVVRRMRNLQRREQVLGPYGPLSLILLIGTWAAMLITGFALLQWAMGSHLHNPTGAVNFFTELYMSGTTFFTLGLGDVTPLTPWARLITVAEAGTGFGVLALVISYLPVLYQAFSRREVNISLLDARAGSPPTAVELLRRHCLQDRDGLTQFLRDWERWAAEVLESHLSYQALGYFRSQHENQSWLAALTVIMDVCVLVMVGIDDIPPHAARLTFAMARHAAVDLSQVYDAPPMPHDGRLSPGDLIQLRALLAEAGIQLATGAMADKRLTELRQMYEPYVAALSHLLILELPLWLPAPASLDDWETSRWEHELSASR